MRHSRVSAEAAPKVFVSSTVRDLGDLRSAVKWWLEEYGYEVFTSEAPDFPAGTNARAVDAARSVIDGCQYFVLIVGTRRGSLWPDGDVSITRAEFRHARQLARKNGVPGIVTFVRRDVLVEYRSGGRPADCAPDEWEHQLSFLAELNAALGPNDPNWIHAFAGFSEIVETLRATLRVTGPLARRSLEVSLCHELAENTRRLLLKTRRGVGPLAVLVESSKWIAAPDTVEHVSASEANALAEFYIFKPSVGRLSRLFLHEALKSGLFLDFDPRTATPSAGPVQAALLELNGHLDGYERALEPIAESMTRELLAVIPDARGGSRRPATISWTAARWYHLTAAELLNTLSLSRALYRYFTRQDSGLSMPAMKATLPNPRDAEEIEREWVSAAEATQWLALSRWPEPQVG